MMLAHPLDISIDIDYQPQYKQCCADLSMKIFLEKLNHIIKYDLVKKELYS